MIDNLAEICMLGVSLLKADSPIYLLYVLVFLGSCGFAFCTICTLPFAQRSLDPSSYGTGQGTLQFFSSGSVAFIGFLLGIIMGFSGKDIASGLSHSFLFGFILCFAIAVIALVFIRQEDIVGKKKES